MKTRENAASTGNIQTESYGLENKTLKNELIALTATVKTGPN